jgi:hypothetical protein
MRLCVLFFQNRPFHKRYKLATIVMLRIRHLIHRASHAIALRGRMFVFSNTALFHHQYETENATN